MRITITALPSPNAEAKKNPSHHVGSPPTSFCNPWPSHVPNTLSGIFSTRFLRTSDKTNLPVPHDREGLVSVQRPGWGDSQPNKLKATWIGHASFLVETATIPEQQRGIRVLLDPVFSDRTSPVQWFGPKRYNPPPCTIEELPEVDIIAISHNHYDHLDATTIKEVWRITKNQKRPLVITCPLGNKQFFEILLPDLPAEYILELDWWDSIRIDVPNLGGIEVTATPAQHTSARSVNDKDKTLWCSWVLQIPNNLEAPDDNHHASRSLFFAGDTGYRHVNSHTPTPEEQNSMPHCPAFQEIGNILGPFDLALLPIGLYSPRDLLSSVHCAPEDAICIHRDIKSKRSIGMHYGTVRGGLSAQYEDVLEPPRRWKAECEKAGLRWGAEVGLCNIGETVIVD